MELDITLASLAALLFGIYCLILKHQHRKYANIPKATPRIPFVGNAANLDMSRCHIVLTDWALKFGPVFRINVFNEEILVLNNFDSIHDALVQKGSAFAGRPPMYRTSKSERHKHSIVWQTYTEQLQFLRKEVLKSLKMYGDGMDNLEHKCTPEIWKMLENIRSWSGTSFDPWDHIYEAVSGVMLGLTLNTSLDHSSRSFQTIKDINHLFNDTFGTGSARSMDFLPWLSKFWCHKYSQRLQTALKLRDEFWDQELKLLQKRTESDCIVQRFMSLTTDPRGKQMNVMEVTAKEVFTNLILAGTDTTATSLTCLLLVFLHYPEIQEKMWEELRNHVGENRLATLADRAHLPYIQAVLLELLRYISHVPLAVPHYTTRDTSVLGVSVPKNMTVYINLWSLHHDPIDWPEPWTFKPERFLDDSAHILPVNHPVRRKKYEKDHQVSITISGELGNLCYVDAIDLFVDSDSELQERSSKLEDVSRKYGIEVSIDKNKILATSNIKLMTFGAGRRVCLGEALAKNRLFLFAAALVQNFRFVPLTDDATDKELPDLDPRTYEMGLVLHPKRFQLRAIHRN